MRLNVLSKHSTKSERRVYEVLKKLKLPFRHRWLVQGREIDFIVGKLAIEIDGHEQDEEKNNLLVSLGYTPVHLHNSEVTEEHITKLIQTYKWLLQK